MSTIDRLFELINLSSTTPQYKGIENNNNQPHSSNWNEIFHMMYSQRETFWGTKKKFLLENSLNVTFSFSITTTSYTHIKNVCTCAKSFGSSLLQQQPILHVCAIYSYSSSSRYIFTIIICIFCVGKAFGKLYINLI